MLTVERCGCAEEAAGGARLFSCAMNGTITEWSFPSHFSPPQLTTPPITPSHATLGSTSTCRYLDKYWHFSRYKAPPSEDTQYRSLATLAPCAEEDTLGGAV